MGVSPLVDMKRVSPNRNTPRNHKIDTITIHCYVGQASIEAMADWLCNPIAEASANYCIGSDGRIASLMDDNDRSWCSSSSSNDNRAITIECASDMTHPYAINDTVYNSLIDLCADICKRHGIKELKWRADKSLIGHTNKQNITVHRWFANKACPGDYIYNRLDRIASDTNKKINISDKQKLQARDLIGLTNSEIVEKVGPFFTIDHKKTGILASVSMAQFILESGYGKELLAQEANNCFGMKINLSGNTWSGSTWDGKSIYRKVTVEQDECGKESYISADFRCYQSIEDSISDHSAYLLGAKSGKKLRYAGLKGCASAKQAIEIIKNGGYATDINYCEKLLSVIKRNGLNRFNCEEDTYEKKYYRVRKTWTNPESQKGAFIDLENAIDCANQYPGYSVYDDAGKIIFTSKRPEYDAPYMIRVNDTNLDIYTGPSINYAKTGERTGIGTFTILRTEQGKGSNSGWGKLKSGAGWINLDHTVKI